MKDNNFAKLFERTYIKKLDVPNRIWMAPMGFGTSAMGDINTSGLDYYEERAKGGCGMILAGYQIVTNKLDPGLATYYYVGTTMQDAGWIKLVERCHAYGTKICLQMTPGLGQNARPVPGKQTVSASVSKNHWDPTQMTRPITKDEIKMIINGYARAAEHAKACGVDAIEIHGHLGYIMDSFMTELWNQRDDEYGGSFENRMRLVTEVYQVIREKVGPDFPIMIRLVLDSKVEGGRTVEESIKVIKYLDELGIDAFDVDLGCYDAYDWAFPTAYMGDAPLSYVGEIVRKVTNKPIITCGSYTPETAVKAVEDGLTDYVMLGRGVLADPEWARKLAENRREDIRPCLRCNEYCLTKPILRAGGTCSVNAQCCFEKEYALTKTEAPKKVVIVGAGPGGLEAARVAATIGHDVTIYDKAADIGGQLIAAETPKFKGQIRALREYFRVQMKKLGVNVVLNHEITAESPELEAADHIIIATGAKGFVPPIPGTDRANVLEVTDAHTGDQSRIGQRVVVCGGGFSGVDCAIDLAMEGKEVALVEMLDKIAPKASLAPATSIARTIKEQNIKVLTGTKVKEINDEGVVVENADGVQTLPCDTVIAAFGTRPVKAKEILDKYWNAVEIGDCTGIGQIGEAVRAGFFAARAIQ